MKKEYRKPEAEKVEFNYTESVVASSSVFVDHNGFTWTYIYSPMPGCTGAFQEGGDRTCGFNDWNTSNPQAGRCLPDGKWD